jgi:hypothetical protein
MVYTLLGQQLLAQVPLNMEVFNPIPNAYLDSGPYVGHGERMMTKVKMLYN